MISTILAASAPEADATCSPTRVAHAEAEARAEATIPAIALVEASVFEALADFYRAIASVGAATRPVVVGEIDLLTKQVRETTAAFAPLLQRLSGARTYAYSALGRRSAPCCDR